MTTPLPGLHHVTAIAADPQRNLDFYAGLLGLRLVKRTVNFDDPNAYHLYYGDAAGNPGSIITFFLWPGARTGREGTGQATATAFAIPTGSIDFWRERLTGRAITVSEGTRFDQRLLTFADPDGMRIELIAADDVAVRLGWDHGPVPAMHAVRGLHSVTLSEDGRGRIRAALPGLVGFTLLGQEGPRRRYAAAAGGSGALVDVLATPEGRPGIVAAGTVHHVAWRTADDASQLEWQRDLAAHGVGVSPVMDRDYFHSIYFREPGGVLFEIATDPPGFAVDEPADALGTALKLPEWLEAQRAQIARHLPPLRIPA